MSDYTPLIIVAVVIFSIWHGMAAYVVWLHKRIVKARTAAIEAYDVLEPWFAQRHATVLAAKPDNDLIAVINDYHAPNPLPAKVETENAITRYLLRKGDRADAVLSDIARQAEDFNTKASVFNQLIAGRETALLRWTMELAPYPKLEGLEK